MIPKRILFVLDRSGSMAGEMIGQAQAALRFAVNHLGAQDAVNVIDYGTAVTAFADSAVAATSENQAALRRYLDGLIATGGTYIHGALITALGQLRGDDRAELVVFLTDGRPTIGERDTERILADVRTANQGRARLFVFGVGLEVNTHLLDRLAAENGGTSIYVKPGEDLEVAVSSLYQQVSSPVLEDLQLAVSGARVSESYPPALPDLFRGSQVIQLGRLSSVGPLHLRLTGTVQGHAVSFEREVDAVGDGPEFLPRLWATRKVGYLLDEIRLHGEEPELVEEIVSLSRRYGVITPYTSFLIVEDELPEPVLNDTDLKADAGAGAVAASEAVRGYAGAEQTASVQSIEVRYVGNKTFYWRDGYWQDSQYDEGDAIREYTFGTPAYFALLTDRPELSRYLALGRSVIVSREGQVYRVSESPTGIGEGSGTVLPQRPRLDQNYPNPFNGGTTLRFLLPASAEVDLGIYDLTGQRVTTLSRETLPAGAHVLTWDGRGDQGRDLASGLYLCRLQGGGREECVKLLLLR